MEIRYPNYYKKFQCIAGDCPDTCCAGWEIPVDKASEKRYREAYKQGNIQNKEFARKLKKYVKHGQIISEDVTCPFLNRDGLCEMYMELGPEALCHTCARHPRHLEDYGNLHEIVLLMSCPEAARLILEENEGVFYLRSRPERQGNIDGIDQELLNILLKARDLIWKWNADKSMTVNEGMALSAALAHDLQRRLVEHDYAGMRMVLEKYDSQGASVRFGKQWGEKRENGEKESVRFFLMSDFMELFAGLETICRDWPEMLETCRATLYHSEDAYETYSEKYGEMAAIRADVERDKRNIFEYFVYSFVLPALYDADLLTKVKMAVLCTLAVEELYLTAKRINWKQRVNICHAIARQIENSDGNREKLERGIRQEAFCSRRMINALLETEV
ncbi:MAG: hypothetical protein E7246_08000 [Lachnoclostridium sp.]|nr:hypothetical protein [Lachnoclostridium sp.]